MQDVRKWTVILALSLTGGPALPQSIELFQAVGSTDKFALAAALKNATDIDARNAAGDTALLVAARAGNLMAIEALVAAGANINAMDPNRRDILNIAITTQNPEMARLALSLGSDPTLVTSVYDGGAIIYGSAKGAVEIVEMLVTAGAPVNRVNNLGWTALLEVAVLGDGSQPYVDIARMLAGAGADPTIQDRNGLTAYDHAVARGHHDLASVLSN